MKLRSPNWTDDQLRAQIVREIKAECRRRIIGAGMPEYRQLNLIRAGRADDPGFAEVDALRTRSNELEASLATMDRNAMNAFDVKAQNWTGENS